MLFWLKYISRNLPHIQMWLEREEYFNNSFLKVVVWQLKTVSKLLHYTEGRWSLTLNGYFTHCFKSIGSMSYAALPNVDPFHYVMEKITFDNTRLIFIRKVLKY